MIESAVIVLPEPDSPTNPISRPGATARPTRSTTRSSPCSVKNEVQRSLTSSNGCILPTAYHRTGAPLQPGPMMTRQEACATGDWLAVTVFQPVTGGCTIWLESLPLIGGEGCPFLGAKRRSLVSAPSEARGL